MERKKFKQHRKGKHESGQALIEFVLGLMIVISFFFFYVKMAAVFAVGNYIHYATFMSARAYLASATNEEIQRTNAESVLEKMIGKRFKTIVSPMECEGGCPANSMSTSGGRVGAGPFAQESMIANRWNQGVTYSYRAKLSLYPWNRDQEAITMKLVSESWLSREESENECWARKNAIQGQLSATGLNIAMEWDNGC